MSMFERIKTLGISYASLHMVFK